MNGPIDWKALGAPFPPDEIEWRVGNKAKNGKSATLLCYLTARAVMERLDAVVGPARWQDRYMPITEGTKIVGYLCTLSVEVEPTKWVEKTDVSDLTDVEALKGGVSGALKRAAVKWGIGRYLYGVDTRYHPIRDGDGPDDKPHVGLQIEQGRYGHILIPTLPAWALPEPPSKVSKPYKSDTTPAAPAVPRGEHDPEWEADKPRFFAAMAKIPGCASYDIVSRVAHAEGLRPSQVGRVGRKALLEYLATADGQAEIAELLRERVPGEEG